MTAHLLAAGGASAIAVGNGQLVLAALLGIATVVLLIVWAKFHPFLALILGTVVLGATAALAPAELVASFVAGLGSTFGAVGLLIALGAMLGRLLADSGGASQIVDSIVARVTPARLPWAMALIAAIIGLPMFFEIGIVILVPIIILIARRTGVPLMKIGIPALAGLSILHGLVPPHPGPETAISLLSAPLSYTLLYGLVIAVPTLVVAGPLLAPLMDRLVPVYAPAGSVGASTDAATAGPALPTGATRRPSFAGAILSVTLPVLLMLVKAVGDLTLAEASTGRTVTDTIGEPSVALLAGVLTAMLAVGRASGMRRGQIHGSLGAGLPPVASIMLIVAAGGGFKTVLSDSGVADVIAGYATGAHLSVLLLGWLVAVAIRLATGSATVATVTAAGIVAPLAHTLDQPHLALLVLAVGAGSLFFSHVNDAGFWLVKEYFGLTVGQTIKSWSVMETVISVVALVGVLLLSQVVCGRMCAGGCGHDPAVGRRPCHSAGETAGSVLPFCDPGVHHRRPSRPEQVAGRDAVPRLLPVPVGSCAGSAGHPGPAQPAPCPRGRPAHARPRAQPPASSPGRTTPDS